MYSADNQANPFYGIDQLLNYFHMDHLKFPKDIVSIEELADFLDEETCLILIPTSLEGDWYRTAAGPLLVQDQEGIDKAVLPDWRGRYYFRDEGTGRRIYITEKNCRQFSKAYSATLDFPETSVNTPAVAGRMFREMSWYEGGLLLLWGLLGGGLWSMLAGRVHSALSNVILTADQSVYLDSAVSILLLSLLELLLVISGRQVIRRVSQKAALAVTLGIGERLYAADHLHETAATAARLAVLRDNAERVMTWFLLSLWALLAVLVILLSLWKMHTEGFIAAVLIAFLLYIAAAVVFVIRTRGKVDEKKIQQRREWLSHLAADRQVGIERPFPPCGQSQQPKCRLGAAWPVAALLALPMAYIAMENGYSTARLVQMMLLYLPAVALPLGVLLGSIGAGRALAEIRWLLPFAEKRPTGTVPLPPLGSVFELKDVTFTYQDRAEPVLLEVNLRLHPGELVGILGATGSGKTTLARLMTGLVQPTSGNIYYGGIELARYNGSALRQRIAYERGKDILLCEQIPEQRDRRTCVVFSAREDTLNGCDRILRLFHGKLINV